MHVFALLYGDHPEYARRCLESIVRTADWSLISDVHVGLNEVGPATRALLLELLAAVPVPAFAIEEAHGRNVGKYPLMRKMFEHAGYSAETMMWFDDDSYILASGPPWWQKVAAIMHNMDLIGARHRVRMRGQQHVGISAQPWCRRAVRALRRMYFMTGGWWTVKTAKLRQWNYPFPEIQHNGGDSILGELGAQQDWRMLNFREGLAINAGLGETKINTAERRGALRSLWPWENAAAPAPHPDCAVRITALNGATA